MQAETGTDTFDVLIDRLRKLPSKDRKAVLANMSMEQRYMVEQLLDLPRASYATAADEVPAAGKRFAMFSPGFAHMLVAIEQGEQPKGPGGGVLTRRTCDAMREVAADIAREQEKNKPPQAPSIMDNFRSLLLGTGASV